MELINISNRNKYFFTKFYTVTYIKYMANNMLMYKL